jgi:hypothetical protein
VIYRVCCLAGSASLIDNIRADLHAEGVRAAMRKRETAGVFEWLIAALSYQGISDQIAYDYMEQHGYVRWDDIARLIATRRRNLRELHVVPPQRLLPRRLPRPPA